MATLAELATLYTDLSDQAVDHLLGLTASWSLLADLSFSDMLLFAPTVGPTGRDELLVVLGQVRPNNRATAINDDLVGSVHDADDWPLVWRSLAGGEREIGRGARGRGRGRPGR